MVNGLRKARKYSWKQFFDHLSAYRKELKLLLSKNPTPGVCSVKSIHTITALLPKWCDNIAQNMSDILKSGDISCLVCKTRKNNKCHKLDKLKEMVNDPDHEYEIEDIARECELPLDMMEYLVKQSMTYHFVPIAGSHICIGCKERILASEPALIISGGPSVYTYNHLDLLKEYGFKGDIFVVGKMLKDVLEKGIVPDYVGAIDAAEEDTKFFDYDIVDKYSDKMIGLFGITTHPTTQQRFKGKRYYFSGYIGESETPNISHIFHLMTRTSNISVSGNIGSCMYNVASYLGYNPIVMIGMDLSFPTVQDMKDYYPWATDDDWKRTINIGGKEVPMYKRKMNPVYKKPYYVDSVFESYEISHKSWAKNLAFHGIQTINCSEQGALYGKYIKNIRFKEYLENQ